MKSMSFSIAVGVFGLVLIVALLCSMSIINNLIEQDKINDEEAVIVLYQNVNESETKEDEANRYRDYLVARLTALGFESRNYGRNLSIKKDRHYYESIKPQVDKLMEEYYKAIK